MLLKKSKILLIFKFLILFALFVLFLNKLWIKSETDLFHEDEYTFIKRGVFLDLFLGNDFNNQRWQEFASFDVPKLGEYLYGIPFYLYGNSVQEELDKADFIQELKEDEEPWWLLYSRDFYGNEIKDLPESIQVKINPILKARKVAVIFSLLTLLLLFLIGLSFKNWLLGLIYVLIYWFNPLFQAASIRAMGDIPLIFFFVTALIATFKYVELFLKNKFNQALMVSFIIGLICGLATSCKLNGAIILIYFLVLVISVVFFLKKSFYLKKQLSILFFSIVFVLLTFFTTFRLLNPFVWKDPFNNIILMLMHRVKTGQSQQQIFSDASLLTWKMKFSAVIKETLLPLGPGDPFRLKFPLGLTLFLLGILILVVKSYKYGVKNKKPDKNLLMLLWIFTIFITVIGYIPLRWDRYFLPLVFSVAFCQSLAIFSLVNNFIKKIIKLLILNGLLK